MFAYGPAVKEDKDKKVQDLIKRSRELRTKINEERDPAKRAVLVNDRSNIKKQLEDLLKHG